MRSSLSTRPLLGACVAAVVAATAACTTEQRAAAADTATASSPAADRQASAASAAAAPVDSARAAAVLQVVRTGAVGPYLADGAGRALYLFEKDAAGQSACTGACAAAWPPYLVPGVPTASDTSLPAARIATVRRPDGTQQAAYNGHPLYYYVKDTAPGDIKGQDIEEFGAEWYLVAPDGSKQRGRPAGAH